MTMHAFSDSFERGKEHEAALDAFFGARYRITTASRAEERRGIDRWFQAKHMQTVKGIPVASRFSVEYKADERAADTENAFIEVISVDTQQKPGWAVTSEAQYLIYYVPAWRKALTVPMTNIKVCLRDWLAFWPTQPVRNNTYHTIGILLPLAELEAVSCRNRPGKDRWLRIGGAA